jgi:hypothetical protein
MIKNLLAGIAVCSTLIANAQLGNKGQKIATGGLSGAINKSTTTNPNSFNENYSHAFGTNISIGKFTKENVVKQFGIGFRINKSQNNYPNNANDIISKNLGIFYNNTVLNSLSKKWYWAITQQLSVNYGTSKRTNNISPDITNEKSYNIGVNFLPTLYYKLNTKVALNITTTDILGINANYLKQETKLSGLAYTNKNYNLNLQAGFWSAPLQNIAIGINYIW